MAHDPPVPLREAFWVWLRVAALSFGGPAGQIAVMHRIIVEERRWIGEQRFLHALNYCMLLPGPEAQQLATYIGWLMHKTRGGLLAGGLFVLPGIVAIMALSWIYVLYGRIGIVASIFYGLKAAVLVIVAQGVARIAARALRNRPLRLLAALAFVAIFVLAAPFPLIVLAAALIGFLGARAGSPVFAPGGGHGPGSTGAVLADADSLLGAELPAHAQRGWRATIGVAIVWLLLWLAPVVLIVALLGRGHVFAEIATFFSTMALVTFGGAYAVLAYVAQQAVEQHHWLTAKEMLDGLGLAETTPGPLIMVLQFVGFLGAYRAPGGLDPLLAATLGGLLATWVTFAPCFLWIFLGAPYVERLRSSRALAGALTAVTAAVVGVVLNLAIWFAVHTLFARTTPVAAGPVRFDMPVWASADPVAIGLALIAAVAAFRFKAGVGTLVAGSALAGVALHLAGVR
jgi:chromate transporter